jgi:hypothetical protein
MRRDACSTPAELERRTVPTLIVAGDEHDRDGGGALTAGPRRIGAATFPTIGDAPAGVSRTPVVVASPMRSRRPRSKIAA